MDQATSSSSSLGCHHPTTTLHGGESREEKEENTRVPDCRDASSDSEFLAQNFKHTHIHTHAAPKCFDLLATGNSTEGKRANAKSSEKLFWKRGQLCKSLPQNASLFQEKRSYYYISTFITVRILVLNQSSLWDSNSILCSVVHL